MREEVCSFLKYTEERAVRNCPFCDTENSAFSYRCFLCGSEMTAPVRKEPERKKRWWERGFDTDY